MSTSFSANAFSTDAFSTTAFYLEIIVVPEISVSLSGVACLALLGQLKANSLHSLSGVTASSDTNDVVVSIVKTLLNNPLVGYINPHKVNVTTYIDDVQGEGATTAYAITLYKRLQSLIAEANVGLIAPSGEVFDFEAYKDAYSKTRVLLIPAFNDNRKVYIEAEDRVINLFEFDTSRKVYIEAEDRVLKLNEFDTSRIVYIAA